MTIPFASVPSNLRVPFVAAEFDSSRAQQGPALLAFRGLIIGQKLAAGSATANTLRKVTSADQVVALAGRGSMLHRMAKAWFANNKFTEVMIGVLADDAGGTAAAGTITISGPATGSGTLVIYVGGERITVAVASGDSANSIAAALNTAIGANADLPVTAAVVNAVVTWTYKHKGTIGNALDVRANYQDGESFPAGVSAAFAATVTGATDPSLTSLIAALGDTWFHTIAHPYTDATSLSAIETEMSSRFGATRMIDGLAFTCGVGTQGTLSSLGDSRNSPHSCILSQPGKSPVTPPCEYAAAVAAVLADYANRDPARPFQTLPVYGVKPPAEGDLFTLAERNLLLWDGISTSRVSGGQVQLDRVITTSQTNAAGSADTSYLDANTMFTLMYLRYSFRTWIQTRYPRHKLASDGARVSAGQAVITPKIGKAEAVAWFSAMQDLGLVEGMDQFKRDLVVERNAQDVNRLDFLLPPDLINQFIVGAVNIQFRL